MTEDQEEKRERNIAKMKHAGKMYLLLYVLLGMICTYLIGYLDGKR